VQTALTPAVAPYVLTLQYDELLKYGKVADPANVPLMHPTGQAVQEPLARRAYPTLQIEQVDADAATPYKQLVTVYIVHVVVVDDAVG